MYAVRIKINTPYVYYRNAEKKGYTSMFTTEYKNKSCVALSKTSMFTTEISKIQV